jgi:hypothetical protein
MENTDNDFSQKQTFLLISSLVCCLMPLLLQALGLFFNALNISSAVYVIAYIIIFSFLGTVFYAIGALLGAIYIILQILYVILEKGQINKMGLCLAICSVILSSILFVIFIQIFAQGA